MPIYEYTCRKCNAQIEVIQKISDKPLTRHEECGGRLEKEISRAGFQFKGSGWYVTDYAGKKSESKSETKDAAPAKTESADKGGDKPKAEKPKATKAGAATSE